MNQTLFEMKINILDTKRHFIDNEFCYKRKTYDCVTRKYVNKNNFVVYQNKRTKKLINLQLIFARITIIKTEVRPE